MALGKLIRPSSQTHAAPSPKSATRRLRAASLYLVTTMDPNLLNLTHTTAERLILQAWRGYRTHQRMVGAVRFELMTSCTIASVSVSISLFTVGFCCICLAIPISKMPSNCRDCLLSTHQQAQENVWRHLGATGGFGECWRGGGTRKRAECLGNLLGTNGPWMRAKK
jgi:hypothetical protein